MTKHDLVVLTVQGWITSGRYARGSQLPSEAQLAEQTGAGRTTVVRALQQLQRDGWISRIQGVGTFVEGPQDIPGDIAAAVTIRMTREQLAELLTSESAVIDIRGLTGKIEPGYGMIEP